MPELTRLIDRARAARVSDADASRYVAELGRWAGVAAAPRRVWPWWLGGGLALATAAAITILMSRGTTPDDAQPPSIATLQIGPRVAMVPELGAHWRVVAVDAYHTEIVVEEGTVTARLFPGDSPHRLALRGGGAEAVAMGTVYSLTVEDAHASVEVHEGVVEVTHDQLVEPVAAGARWPAATAPRATAAAHALLALAPLPPVPSPEIVDAGEPPPINDAGDPPATDARPPSVDAAPERTLIDRWRQARLLRGQGSFAGAVQECLAIADARDATWSPIALLEAARIELGPRASPERAIELADRFVDEWASHALAAEARDLRCRALRQLGREAECTAAP